MNRLGTVFPVGFLDRAKKLAEQAKGKADQVKDLAQRAMDDNRGADASNPTDPRWGTPYVPGMLGRPGWRERGLTDPAAVLPVAERDRAGVAHTIKSQIVEESFGMGRRWSGDGCSAALFYQLYPEHRDWEPPEGKGPYPEVRGASAATLDDGRELVFIGGGGLSVVLEVRGLPGDARAALARAVAGQLAST